ncbi:hypothetical protein C8F04DRAFT_1399421 [Mycena alexandri]|uniref:Uncharacterized protein n=1 Tax=Mycena alexandri TaxID=1745969 RepID=A0AAD6SH77_9AGAR|nr:hypothetical protein C8F04DRAFT_1399421 [Mycena alexandri]
MSQVDDYTTDVPTTPSLLGDATSDAEVQPPSPDGSTKGLYVRSRPTSMDGFIMDFPSSESFDPNLDFTQFGMTPAVTSPTAPVFPLPPVISKPPPGKKRRYATSVKTLYTGDGTGTSLKTNRATVPALMAVRRELLEPLSPVQENAPSRWKKLKKIIPGLFPRPTAAATRVPMPLGAFNATQTTSCKAVSDDTSSTAFSPSSFMRSPALSLRSFKSTKSKGPGKARAKGLENRPPPVPFRDRPRVHSFSGYLADSELADEDETDAEMTAIYLEALRTVLKVNEQYEFAEVDPNEIGTAL